MTVAAWTETRRAVAAADERLVHALAQLPDDVVAELRGPLDDGITLLAAAYGIGDRLDLEPALAGEGLGPRTVAELTELLSEPDDAPAASDHEDGLLAGHRAIVVTNLPTHYRVPLFAAVARRMEQAGGAFRVLFLSPLPQTREWMEAGELEFDHEFVGGFDLRRDRGRRMLPRRLEARLSAFEPTVVVSAGFSPLVSGRVARLARGRGIPFGIWSGELATRATARSRLRTIQRRRLLRRASFALAYGSRSADYLRTLAPELPVVIARNTTVGGPRTSGGADGVLELLTVARAERGKAIDLVVDAIRGRPGLRCRYTLVGAGPELEHLRARAAGDPRIRFLGAVPNSRVREVYAGADVFLFPSGYDAFGLALVEAMAAGLAPVVAAEPGAVADLCVDGRNALIVRERTVEAWAAALDRLSEPGLVAELGEAAAQTIERRWTIEHSADAFVAGLRLGALVGGMQA